MAALSMALTLTGCSGDDDNGGSTLTINGSDFAFGTNVAPNNLYNTTTFAPGEEDFPNIRSFFIVGGEATSEEDVQVITLIVSYPSTQASIDGTYPIDVDITPDTQSYAILGYMEGSAEFGSTPEDSQGTISVQDLGNNKFKITFNNVILKDGTSATRTIEGYAQQTFALVAGI